MLREGRLESRAAYQSRCGERSRDERDALHMGRSFFERLEVDIAETRFDQHAKFEMASQIEGGLPRLVTCQRGDVERVWGSLGQIDFQRQGLLPINRKRYGVNDVG